MASFVAAFGFPLGGDPEHAGTLALPVELGAKVHYSWETNILTSWSGEEQRIALLARPRRRFEFTSLMTDAQARQAFGTLSQHAAAAPTFLLALAYEDVTIIDVDGADVTVPPFAPCDWAIEGQRVVVVAKDGTFEDAAIVSVASNVLTLDSTLTSAEPGARIMPGLVVYLEDTQQLSHYAVNVSRWNLTAIAKDFQFADGSIEPGTGASIVEFDGMIAWSKGVQSAEANRSLIVGTDLLDLGFSVRPIASWAHSAWGRSLRIESHRRADWQWLKKFLHTVRGRQKAFLLPSGHPDLIPLTEVVSSELVIDAAANYVDAWWPSLAHRRIAIQFVNGTVAYRSVESAEDNGDGTQTLTLNMNAGGAIAQVEFLELCRLESDEVTVGWGEHGFVCEMTAHVVQE